MEASNRAASSLIARLSDGLTASYMAHPDAVPLLTKVLEKNGMPHAAETAWVHHNMALIDMTEMRQDVPAHARTVMNEALFQVKKTVLNAQGKVHGQDAPTWCRAVGTRCVRNAFHSTWLPKTVTTAPSAGSRTEDTLRFTTRVSKRKSETHVVE